MLKKIVMTLLGLLLVDRAAAAEKSKSRTPAFPHLHLALIDLPFNSETHWSYPSMAQSLSATQSFYDIAHWSMERAGLRPRASGLEGFTSSLLYFLADGFLFIYLPLGQGWVHEEWHRAVMANRGVSSYNDIYNLQIGAESVSVSHETDEDLIRLKRESPEDQVRLSAAGMEAELALVTRLQREAFFHGNEVYHTPTYWISAISVTGYMSTCASAESDQFTQDAREDDGGNIPKRDFIGLDCLGWIRDLNRPDEEYEARGVHPSNVGINRYTSWSQLNSEEQKYLKRASNLSYLNFVDPNLFSKREFAGRGMFGEQEARYNASLKAGLTSFGTDTAISGFYASDLIKAHALLHLYQNFSQTFPGFEINIFDYPVQKNWFATVETMAWLQPKDFAFRTSNSEFGGRVGLQIDYRAGVYQPYFKVVGKTRGWVQGDVVQGKSLSVMAGLGLDFES